MAPCNARVLLGADVPLLMDHSNANGQDMINAHLGSGDRHHLVARAPWSTGPKWSACATPGDKLVVFDE